MLRGAAEAKAFFGFSRKLWREKTTTQQPDEPYLRGDVLLWFRSSPSAAMTCLLWPGVCGEKEPVRLTNESLLYSARNCGLHFSLDRQRGFFPEHCLETVRHDVTRGGTSGRRALIEARSAMTWAVQYMWIITVDTFTFFFVNKETIENIRYWIAQCNIIHNVAYIKI